MICFRFVKFIYTKTYNSCRNSCYYWNLRSRFCWLLDYQIAKSNILRSKELNLQSMRFAVLRAVWCIRNLFPMIVQWQLRKFIDLKQFERNWILAFWSFTFQLQKCWHAKLQNKTSDNHCEKKRVRQPLWDLV